MKKLINAIIFGKNTKASGALAIALIALIALGCFCRGGNTQPAPPEYIGAWTGSDGSTLTIRGDGSGDYKSGGFNVTNGAVEIKDGKLSVTLLGFGKTLNIDEPPKNGQMKLDGVTFRQSGSSPVSDDKDADTKSDSKSDETTKTADANTESLVKQTLSDFTDAVEEGDFSSFYAKTSGPFQSSISSEDLTKKFSSFIEKKAGTVPLLRKAANMKANFTNREERTQAGRKILATSGTFQTSPRNVRFDFDYVEEDGDWKIIKIGVYIQ